MSKNVNRLYKSFRPEHYDITLKLDRDKKTFTGNAVITGMKTKPSKRITLHQKGLKVTKASITKHGKKDSKTHEPGRITNHASFQEVRLHTPEQLFPGEYTVNLDFTGKITPQMEGIYPSNFKDGGKAKQLLASQFESHFARQAFPNIDEPEAKATFKLTLESPAGEAVISNTPVEKQSKTKDGLMLTTFETTPRMSTYLLAFVVGELGYKEAKTKSGVVVRTYATPDNVKFTDFALDVAVRTLEFYDEYFEIPYPLPKADLIALPDFDAGAMENWGCITFRESCLIVDPENTALPSKQFVAMVIAHELAHQWFGNLVTMEWWTDLWLNEGFASWVEYLAVDHLFPEWNMWEQFVTDDYIRALRLDALENTHPIEVAVPDPETIRSIFDTISYSKGASVIRMLHEYLGPEPFRKGLVHYLQKHRYANARTADLWEALEAVTKKPVRAFMDAWTSQPGYPLLEATIKPAGLYVAQQRFYLNPKADKDTKTTWPVPLLTPGDSTNTLLTERETTIQAHAKGETPLKINSGQSGVYRVLYDKKHLAAIGEAVSNGALSPIDRLGILADAFETAKAGYGSTVAALDLLKHYEHEDNLGVWDIISLEIGNIRRVMDDDTMRDNLKPFIGKLVKEQLERLGWDEQPNEKYQDTLLRPLILGLASFAEEPVVVTEALRQFKAAKKPEAIRPDIRGIVYGTAVRKGNKETFEKLLGFYDNTTSPDERVTLASALTGFEQPELYKKAMEFIKSDRVKLQDVMYWLTYLFSNRHAKTTMWDWLRKEWPWLEDNLRESIYFARYPNTVASVFSDEAFIKEYKQFFGSIDQRGLERNIKQGLETLEWQSAWKKRDYAPILDWLTKQSTR